MLVRIGLFMWSHMNRPYSYCVYIRGLYRVIRLYKVREGFQFNEREKV